MAGDRAKRIMARHTAEGRAESVTYRPSGGTARAINALVDREGPASIPGAPVPVRTDEFTITVLNDATDGVDAASLDTGLDAIDVPRRFGLTAETRQIGRVADADSDWIILTLA